jgi:Zn-dependent M28 family amino/carboxypeptidase
MEPKPRRSAIFAAVTAEESGLLGSRFLAENPPVPAGRIAANLNFDSYSPYGRARDAVLNGYERTTLKALVDNVAARFQITLKPDQRPQAGSYYRSDHFSFARAGVPAFSINMGSDLAGKQPNWVQEKMKLAAAQYHQPSDEYQEEWDFSGLEVAAKLGFTLGIDIANSTPMPSWVEGDEFKAARDKSWAQ